MTQTQPQWHQAPDGTWHAVQPVRASNGTGCLKALAVVALLLMIPILAVIGITILGAVSGPTTLRPAVTTTR